MDSALPSAPAPLSKLQVFLRRLLSFTILWTIVGLAIVWNSWRREDPEAVLMA